MLNDRKASGTESNGKTSPHAAASSPLRVCILGHGLTSGGGRTVGKNLIPALGRMAPQHEYLITLPAGLGFEQVCRNIPHRQTCIYERRGLFRRWFDETFVLPKAVRAFRPDVILALADRGLTDPPCPQAILVHRAQLFYPPKHYAADTWKNRTLFHYHARHLRKALRRTDLLLCQTPVGERRLRQTYGYAGRTAVVPSPVSRFAIEGDVHLEMPPVLRPYADCFRLFCPSFYYGHKNLEAAVELFRRFRDELRDVVVVMTVAPEQHRHAPRFLRAIRRFGLQDHVLNVGPLPQEHLAAYYRNVHALFMPTLLESFGLPYLEAMHFGVPILTSDLDFAREVCGDAAIYFDPWNPASVKDAVLRLKQNPALAEQLAAKGRARLKTMFKSWDEVARQVADLLAELVRTRKDQGAACAATSSHAGDAATP